jgi:hypothetical protein
MKRGIQLCGATSVIFVLCKDRTLERASGFGYTVVTAKKIIIFTLTNRYIRNTPEQRKLSLFRTKEKTGEKNSYHEFQ